MIMSTCFGASSVNLKELKSFDSKSNSNIGQHFLPNKASLRQMYKQRLRDGPPEDSEGAGLGFIEMARRVKHFEFNFVESEEGALFVYRGWVS